MIWPLLIFNAFNNFLQLFKHIYNCRFNFCCKGSVRSGTINCTKLLCREQDQTNSYILWGGGNNVITF